MTQKKTATAKTVQDFVGKPAADKVELAKEEVIVEPKVVVAEANVAEKPEEVVETVAPTSSDAAPVGQASEMSEQRPPAPRFQQDNNRYDRPQHSQYSSDSGRFSGRDQYGQQSTPTEQVKGFLDIQPEGHGFLRPKFIPSPRDIYISQSQIRRFMLRAGDLVEGLARPPKDSERYYGLLKVEVVNGVPAEDSLKRPHFDDLTAIYPDRQVVLSTGKTPMSTRIIDLVAPIGFGQRGMIVSPPKAGKTTILKELAAGISENFPEVHLMAALIGERPEEVTDISMSVKGEVVASNFDEPPDNQTRVAEITLDRAKRMVEMGKDVIILSPSSLVGKIKRENAALISVEA